MMRLVIDSLVAVMLAAVLAGVVIHNREMDEQLLALEETRQALRQIDQQISLQVALEEVELTDCGHPRTIDPAWFTFDAPRNRLLDAGRPWIEVAGPEQRALLHPLELAANTESSASFWYNPYTGVVRARVPVGISDTSTLEMYNRANGAKLTSISQR